jgi:predicted metalloprotease
MLVQEEEFAEAMLAYFFLAVSPKRITKEGLSILVEDHLKERHRLVVGRVRRFETRAKCKYQSIELFASSRMLRWLR